MIEPKGVSASEKWILIERKAREQLLTRIVTTLQDSGIDYILLKGWASARWYPVTVPRIYNDIDIAVSIDSYQRSLRLRQTEAILNNVDIHCEFRHLDSLTWRDHMRRSSIVNLGEDSVPLRLPCPEDHLRIVATHWLNDGGVNKERLWDIYFSVANRPNNFDWSKCLDCVSETRRGWVITTIGLAHKYLGLNIDDLPFRDEALRIPKWVTDTLEREWATEEPIRPLQTCTRDPKLFLRQLKRRIPPNPIQATIQMEAAIDDRGRTMIQLRNVIRRAGPSVERISSVLRGRMKRNSK